LDGSLSASDSFVLTVTAAANVAPTITTTKPASLTTNEDTAGSVILAATDANGDTLTWSVLTQGTKGTASASGTGSPKVVTYTPTANLNGSDSFVVQVSDGNGGTDTITVNVTITAVNDTPLATAQSVSVTEDTAKPITLAGSDVEGSTLTYAIGTAPTKGVLSGTAPSLTYTPNLNATGSDSFTFTVNDGTATSAAATVSITITAVNDPPVNSVAPTTSGKSTVGRVQTATSGTWSDSDGSVTGYAYQWQRSIGGGAYADIIGATTATYTPLAGDAGSALRVQVTASDNGTPGIASAAAVSSPTVVKVKSSSPTVTTLMTQATATPSVAGSGEFSATIRVYDGSVLIGTVTVDGGGSWIWTPGTPLTSGTHLLMVTAELSPSGESSDVGPIVVNAPSGGTGTAVVATAGNGGGGCGAGGLAGILAMGLTLGLMRRRYPRSDDAEGGAGGAIP
jgi:VCBS repeat-containing protein